ncbi:MAG: hypothetical protein OEY09_04980 [Gammaproteobacteria bacterium]|nr:hypothetical protein [Gammaproteobacteria bacterium]
MPIKISVFGFGDDSPALFQNQKKILLNIDTPATPRAVILEAGFDEAEGLVLMIDNGVIVPQDWDSPIVKDGDDLRVMSAFEGG